MCGIIGIIAKQKQVPVKKYLKLLRDAVSHRGPDDYGEHIGNNYGFANLRLSIVDIAGGKQPIFNDDKSIGIVYNGEIYNYRSLRKEVIAKGYKLKTKTDTEVILKAYEEYGIDSFNKLKGMFAFCIWDNKKDTVYLVRDYFGIKPLYIYEDDKQLIFSSELKGILSIPNVDLSLDPLGFQDYLMFRYVQAPYTFFKRIRRLDAGTYLEIKKGNATQYPFWDLNYDDPYPKPKIDDIKKEIMKKMEESVKSQLMGEVPVGVLLSGGIDSSTIAYFVKKCGANLKTFNIGFPEVNEFKYSSEVAKDFGLEHIEITVRVDELVRNFDNVMLAIDEPIADPACLPLYVLCQELKKHVTVVLSGEGGDEVFAGYNQYLFSLMDNRPYQQRFKYFLQRSWYFENYRDFMNDSHLPDITLRYKKYFEEQPLLNGMLAYDMKTWMPENLMMKADKILMAHSLEGRFPFLDKELFEYAARLPQEYKLSSNGTTKWILKNVLKPHLPKSVINREKMGFTVPVDKLLDELKPQVLEVFEKIKETEVSQVLNTGYMKEFVNKYFRGDKNISALQVWTLFVMCYWFVYCMPGFQENKNLLPGRKKYSKEKVFNPTPEKREEVRRQMSEKYIIGNGIEIGASHCPLYTSKNAKVKYVDILSEKESGKKFPELKHIKVDIIDDGEILLKILDDSLDFIIANHFLEHTKNPLGTIRNHLSKIKKKGILYYAIPNKNFTFDKDRKITSFEHLIEDDKDDGKSTNLNHYEEWAKFIDKLKDTEKIKEHANELMEIDERIHFHVWDADAIEDFFIRAKEFLRNSFDIECFIQNDNEVIVVLRKN